MMPHTCLAELEIRRKGLAGHMAIKSASIGLQIGLGPPRVLNPSSSKLGLGGIGVGIYEVELPVFLGDMSPELVIRGFIDVYNILESSLPKPISPFQEPMSQ